jgi:hypothetical protein
MTKFALLTVGNPKTMKGEKAGYLTAILHLAPASLSGWNVCPMATEGCRAACLNTAGRGGMAKGAGRLQVSEIVAGTRTNSIQAARVRRTRWFFTDRPGFMTALANDIARFVKFAKAHGMLPAVRLNGTSDIRWEREAVPVGPGKAFRNLMTLFPGVQFYDYTKIANRRDLPANYRLTFSAADGNEEQAKAALAGGMSVAVVFRSKEVRAKYMAMGEWPFGARVIDGDETDLRFLDPAGVIVGLYAKGNAKADRSGFVRD